MTKLSKKELEDCKHNKWKTILVENVITNYVKPTFFTDGFRAWKKEYTQECEQCGLINKI